MSRFLRYTILIAIVGLVSVPAAGSTRSKTSDKALAEEIRSNRAFPAVLERARAVLRTGLNAGSIGLTVYPPYPKGYFKNPSMVPFGYQNGGDWTWFGGRMIQQLIAHGCIEQAYRQMLPMVERVERNDGFFEWYTVTNEPKGSGLFRGSAGVLGKAIQMFQEWAERR